MATPANFTRTPLAFSGMTIALATALMVAPRSVSAQIGSVPDFYPGAFTETFEGYSNLIPVSCFRPASGVFVSSGAATGTLCALTAAGTSTSGIQARNGGWVQNCTVAAFAGTNFCGNSSSTARLTFTFNELVGRFGGRFSTNQNANVATPATVDFYDAGNALIGSSTISFSGCGSGGWAWNGWQSASVGIKKIQIYGASSGICVDNATYDIFVPPVTGSCCTAAGACSETIQADCTSGTWTTGATCLPNLCPQPSSGVCCRGATCDASLAQGDCTTSGGTAGAAFASAAPACNSDPTSNNPCCYANYNKANGVTVQDIFDFLADWFAASPYASTGGSGAAVPLTVQNIFDFLAAWFAGGC